MTLQQAVVLTFALTLLAVACGWLGCLWYLRHRTPVERADGPQRCETCQRSLGPDALRTHDGRWVCSAHKVQALG